MDEKKKGIVKSSLQMSAMTMISRVFGLVRDQVQATFLGTTGFADAYVVALGIPNLLRRLFAEGAMAVSFVPIFTEVEGTRTKEETERFLSSFFTLLFIVMILVVVAGYFLAPFLVRLIYLKGEATADKAEKVALAITLTRMMFPYIMFISLAAVVQGVLNVHKNFTVPAFTPVLLNISIIATVLVIHNAFPALFPNITFAFALGVLFGGAIQLFFQVPFLFRTGYRLFPAFHFNDPAIFRIAKLFAPGIFGIAVYQVNVLLSWFFAQSLGKGRISALMFSSRINELTLGIFAVSVATVMLPTLSKEVTGNNRKQFLSSLSYSYRLLALVTIPATVGIFILNEEIVSLLFEFGKFDVFSVELTATALKFLCLAIFCIAAYRVTAQSFYSLKDTRTPVVVAFVGLVLNAVLCLVLPSVALSEKTCSPASSYAQAPLVLEANTGERGGAFKSSFVTRRNFLEPVEARSLPPLLGTWDGTDLSTPTAPTFARMYSNVTTGRIVTYAVTHADAGNAFANGLYAWTNAGTRIKGETVRTFTTGRATFSTFASILSREGRRYALFSWYVRAQSIEGGTGACTRVQLIVPFADSFRDAEHAACSFIADLTGVPYTVRDTLDLRGIAIANALANTLMFVLLFILLRVRLGERIMTRRLSFLQTLAAASVMGTLAAVGKVYFLSGVTKATLLWRLFVVIGVCAGVYAGLNYLLGNRDVRAILRMRRGTSL